MRFFKGWNQHRSTYHYANGGETLENATLMFPTEVGSVPRSRILAVFPVNYRESSVCELSDLAAGATLSAWLEVADF